MVYRDIMLIINMLILKVSKIHTKNKLKEEVIQMIMLKFIVLYLDLEFINMLKINGQRKKDLKVQKFHTKKRLLPK